MNRSLTVAIGIPTSGRRDQIQLTLRRIAEQTHLPAKLLVCPVAPHDFDQSATEHLGFPVATVTARRGLSAQRNALIRGAMSEDLLIYFDDDFYPTTDYITEAIALFARHPDVVVATHHPKLDGASGRGISHDDAMRALEEMEKSVLPSEQLSPTYAGYGCNMVVRIEAVREHEIWFDENLPLYSWLEDVDFSRRLAKHGRIVQSNRLRGVHLGTKLGRTSGLRFGYSQIANPMYMLRKGSMDLRYALQQMSRNVLMNTLLALWPEPWVDRAGRFRGNAIALRHLLGGKLHPLNVKELE